MTIWVNTALKGVKQALKQAIKTHWFVSLKNSGLTEVKEKETMTN